MQNKNSKIRYLIFTIFIILYYVLTLYINNDKYRIIQIASLIMSLVMGLLILKIDVDKISTTKKKIAAFIIILILAIGFDILLEMYEQPLAVKIILILAFSIFYGWYLNYDLFDIRWK